MNRGVNRKLYREVCTHVDDKTLEAINRHVGNENISVSQWVRRLIVEALQDELQTASIDWLSDDITFCGNECTNKACYRHPCHIKHPRLPHSYSLLQGTDMCPSYYRG